MRLLGTQAPAAVILIRLVVGGIFLSEGIQKFLFPGELGPGRFAKETPLPAPGFFAYLDGVFEIGCGVLLIIGLLTRLAAIPMIINMIGAEVFTKVPILVQDGFWEYAHEARTELGQLFGSLFLLIVGAGAWSLDARLSVPPHPHMQPDTEPPLTPPNNANT
ncbi:MULTISPECIES: DoxX family protein [Saccharopolyspora]|uniref:DoxX family protein n=1 Tax=Saccharopolyspora TaxID=1835 RepID=UPI001A9F3CD5|nr:DoxX family protein [Saccharopolyspora elongata]